MARKAPNKFIGYVNIYLNEEDKKAVNDLLLSHSDCLDVIAEWSEEGYSVSIKWDHKSDCHIVSVVGQYTTGITAGRAISQRHTDVCKAFTALWYIVDQKYPEGVWVEINLPADSHSW